MPEKETTKQGFSIERALLAIGLALAAGAPLLWRMAHGDDQLAKMYFACAVILLLALVFYGLFAVLSAWRPRIGEALAGPRLGRAYGAVVFAVFVYFALVWQETENGGNPKNLWEAFDLRQCDAPRMAVFFLFLAGFMWLLAHVRAEDWRPLVSKAACAALLVASFLYVYTPNILNRSDYTVHHYNAVEQTIYNIAFNTPYTVETTGVYGHYPLFFWPFLRVLGHDPRVVSALLALANVLASFLFYRIVCHITASSALQALACFAWGARFVANQDTYAATFPTRLLMPMLVLLYALHGLTAPKRPKRFLLRGYALCGAAVLYSTDSGLPALVAFSGCVLMQSCKEHGAFSGRMWRTLGACIVGCVGAVAGMVAVINLYNLLCGGPLVLRACFFPLLDDGMGYVEDLQTNLTRAGISWYIPVGLFLMTVALALLALLYRDRAIRTATMGAMFCGLMGLGECYLFFNRSLAGWSSVLPYIIMALLYLIEWGRVEGLPAGTRPIQKGVRAGAAIMLCAAALCGLLRAPGYYSEKVASGLYSMQSMEQAAAAVEEAVPRDTYAFGSQVQDLYAYMGWDPGYHLRAHTGGTCRTAAQAELNEQNTVLTSALAGFRDLFAVTPDLDWLLVGRYPEGPHPTYLSFQRIRPVRVLAEKEDFELGPTSGAELTVSLQENKIYQLELELDDTLPVNAVSGITVELWDAEKCLHSWAVYGDEPLYTDALKAEMNRYKMPFDASGLLSAPTECTVRVLGTGRNKPIRALLLRAIEMEPVE